MCNVELLLGDSLVRMKELDDRCIDLTVTSPPYDNLRAYNGFTFDFEGIAKELYRVTKHGGVVVWVVGDATVKGSESGTSFRQALYFMSLGFNLHDTMIFTKHGMPTDPRLRYFQRFEYMFVLSKGKPTTYTPLKDAPSSNRKQSNGVDRRGDKLVSTVKKYQTPATTVRGNVWEYNCRNMGGLHPAMFPEQLAQDHILSWSKEGDTVFDPFLGSGTTGKMAVLNNRNFIGCEISKEYLDIATERINCATLSS